MFTYYIIARPETIVELVEKGQLPINLPDWVEPKQIICFENINADVLAKSKTNYHQTFILQLELISSLPGIRKDKDASIILQYINPNSIRKIFTYSQRGEQLLRKLFNNTCKIPIEIKPEIYPERETNKISIVSSTGFFNRKREREGNRSVQEDQSRMVLQRISTQKEHLDALRSAFRTAKRAILITSYAITHQTLRDTGLYSLIEQACRRGVRIYCYFNDYNRIEENIRNFFNRHGVFYDEAYNHSKILAVDHSLVILGSFNWLSCIDNRYHSSSDGSIICRGDICGELTEDLWKYIRYYRNIQFENFRQVERFERKNECAISYEIGRRSELTYLTTLDQHLGFFQSIFKEAQDRIIICSPFISSVEAYREDIDHKVLGRVAERGVKIFFVCSTNDPYLPDFRAFLESVGSSKIYLIEADNFHLKTIVVDKQLIAEGSFNWLSAARDSESEFHNQEATILVEGNMATELIDHFYNSLIGNIVLNAASQPSDSERKTKRARYQFMRKGESRMKEDSSSEDSLSTDSDSTSSDFSNSSSNFDSFSF